MPEDFDAIVVGGGPAGGTAACLLSRAGWTTAVIERAPFPRRKVCGEYLSPTNFNLLRRLGLAERFLQRAGPPVRRAGLFARDSLVTAPMPRGTGAPDGWGRALGREVLDTLLLEEAARAGARVWQPWAVALLERQAGVFRCRVVARPGGQARDLRAPVVIAAHGSWETGALPTQPARHPMKASDLIGFKAHFVDAALNDSLMPLLVFPGGYGGLVHTDAGRVSLSCCVRRDALAAARGMAPGLRAGPAVLAWIRATCRPAGEALAGARLDGDWLAAGPIRPGVRPRFAGGIFRVGNAAGEAHPIIAEGISMAMQSAWMLCDRLIAGAADGASSRVLAGIGEEYAAAWRETFVPRVRAAGLFANLSMRPAANRWLLPLFRCSPGLLTVGARWGGKSTELTPSGHVAQASCL